MEKAYDYEVHDVSVVEKVVDTKDVSIAHAIVKEGERFPTHNSNAIVQIIIVKGELGIRLNNEDEKNYKKGNIIQIPFDFKMEISNSGKGSLEFFAIKAPSPTFK